MPDLDCICFEASIIMTLIDNMWSDATEPSICCLAYGPRWLSSQQLWWLNQILPTIHITETIFTHETEMSRMLPAGMRPGLD